jgi:zinc transport system ATP-binding protein
VTAALDFDDVTFGYAARPVVEGVSLTVESGEFLGLVGPNGSGKSTLLELALGLHDPDEGRVRLFGERPADALDGGRVGYVAQSVSADPGMPVTVREVVASGRTARMGFGFADEDDRTAVTRAMERVGVTALADRRVGRLSGGQRQRTFIARALAGDADLLVLDEPTVGVDAESREAFYGLLHELNDEGLTVLLVEHDIGVVTAHADRVACLNRRLYFHGASQDFADSDALADAYGANHRLLHHDHD